VIGERLPVPPAATPILCGPLGVDAGRELCRTIHANILASAW
jgi:hypothetical protein